MADCLVLGGGGFLGSRVAAALARDGHGVAAYDRFTRGVPDADGVRPIVGDMRDLTALRSAMRGVEHVLHFVSTTTPASAAADPVADLETNVRGAIDVFAIAADEGIARLSFASSGGAIYGDRAPVPVGEEAVPRPISPYAIGKLAIESYLRYFERTRGLASVSFRISNPYGPGQRGAHGQGVIPIFLRAVAAGEPVTVFGDGSSVRDYLYVDDAAAMVAATVGADLQHDVYNVGSGVGTSLTELVDLTREVTGHPVRVRETPRPATFVERSILDTSRYRAEFGVEPRIALADGVRRTWERIAGDPA